MSRPAYTCDGCGACCRRLIVEVESLDVLREPRIAAECHRLCGHGALPPEEWQWNLWPKDQDWKDAKYACNFLGPDNRCAIYATRPNVCVAMQAGSTQCQQVRGQEGLPGLRPDENPSRHPDVLICEDLSRIIEEEDE